VLEANLATTLGETCWVGGDLRAAIRWLERSVNCYESVGVSGQAAYVRLLLADVLIAAGFPEAALGEVLAALPVIEGIGLVPDGFMAVALLRESIKQHKADPEALRQLREHLQRQH
jgi:hypothetical protein